MPAGRKIGYAVVGLGSIAKSSILLAFKNRKQSKLVAIVGGDKKSVEAIARKLKGQSVYAVADYAGCLANPEIDFTDCAT